ncbi:hypothetical protein ACFXO7_01970 [Nocardia tengchongensis]|uniref:hypothetical protein n=1 Tax=Nocardia tengchongensis TaxID=2055889 RepID=UPI003679B3D8
MAITYYWGLARLLAMSGISFDDVADLLYSWLRGERRIWFMPAVDDTTGLKPSVLMGRSDSGDILVLLARIDRRDIYIINASRPSSELVADFEAWEARND